MGRWMKTTEKIEGEISLKERKKVENKKKEWNKEIKYWMAVEKINTEAKW